MIKNKMINSNEVWGPHATDVITTCGGSTLRTLRGRSDKSVDISIEDLSVYLHDPQAINNTKLVQLSHYLCHLNRFLPMPDEKDLPWGNMYVPTDVLVNCTMRFVLVPSAKHGINFEVHNKSGADLITVMFSSSEFVSSQKLQPEETGMYQGRNPDGVFYLPAQATTTSKNKKQTNFHHYLFLHVPLLPAKRCKFWARDASKTLRCTAVFVVPADLFHGITVAHMFLLPGEKAEEEHEEEKQKGKKGANNNVMPALPSELTKAMNSQIVAILIRGNSCGSVHYRGH